jgi:hypothetical protein
MDVSMPGAYLSTRERVEAESLRSSGDSARIDFARVVSLE